MRVRLLVQVFSFAVIVTIGVMWMRSRTTAVDLQTHLSALTTARRHTSVRLEQERDRLRFELAEANLQRQSIAPATLLPPMPPLGGVTPWSLGTWRSPREWRNEGQSTPRGTVDTLLWAAAGGDLAAMMSLVTLDETSRNRARALFESLTPDARLAFPSPEALVAGLTIHAVPASAAQLSWFHQRDDDHATVGVFLGLPDESAATQVSAVSVLKTNSTVPIAANVNKLTILSLERSASGWHVVMPAAAVDFLARQSQVRLMTGLEPR